MDSSLTAIRGKDWLFNALWSASGDIATTSCKIEIPITVLFRDGKPFRCLQTNQSSGLVSRLYINEIEPERIIGDQGFRGQANKEIRLLRQLLIQFSHDKQYNDHQQYQEEPYICKVQLHF